MSNFASPQEVSTDMLSFLYCLRIYRGDKRQDFVARLFLSAFTFCSSLFLRNRFNFILATGRVTEFRT